MIEKYYSEILDKYFDNKRECLEAELAENKRVEKVAELHKAKKARSEEVAEAYKHYMELRDAFVKDYGGYNLSYSNIDGEKKVEFLDFSKLLEDWFE